MAIYITILLSVMLVSTIGQNYSVEKDIHLGRYVERRWLPSVAITFVVCAILIFFFAARWYVGTDFHAYYTKFYKLLGMSITELIGTRDWGYYVLTAFIGKYVFTDYFLYSLILGAIIYIPVVMTYRKYTDSFVMTLALYIMMCLYTWPYNGVRQGVAVSLMFVGFPLLFEKRNWWKYIVLVAIAYTFHSTAIMVAPFIILCRLKPWKKPFVLVCVIIATLALFLPNLWTTIINALESIGQAKMAEDYADYEKLRAGINFIRVVVAALPVFISFIYYPILKQNNKHIDFIINMCVFNLIFLMCGNILTVLARFASYFNIALPLLVPEFVKLFRRGSQPFARVLIYGAYFMHMVVLLPNDSGLIPYEFLFGKI